MDNKQMLEQVEADLQSMLDNGECKVIELIRYNYSKIGIGNDEMKSKVIEFLLSECRKQINEL